MAAQERTSGDSDSSINISAAATTQSSSSAPPPLVKVKSKGRTKKQKTRTKAGRSPTDTHWVFAFDGGVIVIGYGSSWPQILPTAGELKEVSESMIGKEVGHKEFFEVSTREQPYVSLRFNQHFSIGI